MVCSFKRYSAKSKVYFTRFHKFCFHFVIWKSKVARELFEFLSIITDLVFILKFYVIVENDNLFFILKILEENLKQILCEYLKENVLFFSIFFIEFRNYHQGRPLSFLNTSCFFWCKFGYLKWNGSKCNGGIFSLMVLFFDFSCGSY